MQLVGACVWYVAYIYAHEKMYSQESISIMSLSLVEHSYVS